MSHLAHGLSYQPVSPDWARLTVAEVAPVLARHPGVGVPRQIVWHSRRPFAASALVRCEHAQVFVKRHDPRVRNSADLREEHAFIAHLRDHGAAVPHVLADGRGATAADHAGGVYEVHVPGAGADRYRDAQSWIPVRHVADAQAAGAALARLHEAAASYGAPVRRTRRVVAGDMLLRADDPCAALESWMKQDPMLDAALAGRDWRTDFAVCVLPLLHGQQPLSAAQKHSWVHGDFHVSNMLWRDDAVSCVFDFGLSNRASAVFDLATAIERNAVAWLDLSPESQDVGHADLACAILDGYESVLPGAGTQALRAILPVVHLDFALSELAYFSGITGSRENADLAYHGFLLGHAAWFASEHGQKFLDRLA